MKLIVEGLPGSVTSDDLCSLFQAYGTVTFVTVVFPSPPEDRGRGCVEMSTRREAEAALHGLDNTMVEGATIRIKTAARSPDPLMERLGAAR